MPVNDERGEGRHATSDDRVDQAQADGGAVSRARDGREGPAVEGHEPKDEDEASQCSKLVNHDRKGVRGGWGRGC